MGGMGSGGQNSRHRGTVEGWRRIDAAKMQKHGELAVGWFGRWTWTSDDGEENYIHLSGGHHSIRLSYRYRQNGGDWQDVSQTVHLDWSPRHFGGEQAYFLCPKCGSRRRYLVGAGARFLCQACHGLVHAASREGESDRVFRRMWKVKRKIGAELALGGLRGAKPKGMHRATHDRLMAELDGLERAALDDSYRMLMRLQARGGRRRWSRPDF
ncbi:MAG: hypothetical protein GVY06_01760 [Alphaproteobacteria bacterium]|jgi:hypothetical protein|nr:hypothetical protein [Alphaproteobacteria bacterium]